MPSVPAPPAGATTIVLNWHWACSEPPPPLDMAGVTVCTSCNIAISVRVGSPGNTGDLVQSIAAQTAAAAANIAGTVQAAIQAAAPAPATLPITPPALDPPALLAPVAAGLSTALTPVAAGLSTALTPAFAPLRASPLDAGLFTAPLDPTVGEDAPRRGAPLSYGAASGRPAYTAGASSSVGAVLGDALAAPIEPFGRLPRRLVGSDDGASAAPSRSATSAARPPRTPTPGAPAPTAPTPFVLAAGAASSHGGGIDAGIAIASAFALLFLYAVYSALRGTPAVPPARADGARPHPPG